MTESTADITALIGAIEYFEDLSPADLETIASSTREISLARGQKLFRENDALQGIFIVREGELKLTMIGMDGREQILYVARAGKVIAEGALMDEGVHPANAEAIKDCELVILPIDQVVQWVQSMPALARGLLRLQSRRTARFVRLIEDLSLKSVQNRLASFLYTRALKQGAEAGEPFELTRDLTVETVAGQLGTVREEISRMLSLFEQCGILQLSRATITVLDLDGLERAIYEPLAR